MNKNEPIEQLKTETLKLNKKEIPKENSSVFLPKHVKIEKSIYEKIERLCFWNKKTKGYTINKLLKNAIESIENRDGEILDIPDEKQFSLD